MPRPRKVPGGERVPPIRIEDIKPDKHKAGRPRIVPFRMKKTKISKETRDLLDLINKNLAKGNLQKGESGLDEYHRAISKLREDTPQGEWVTAAGYLASIAKGNERMVHSVKGTVNKMAYFNTVMDIYAVSLHLYQKAGEKDKVREIFGQIVSFVENL